MIKVKNQIKLECTNDDGRVVLRIWRDKKYGWFEYYYKLEPENAVRLANEILSSLNIEGSSSFYAILNKMNNKDLEIYLSKRHGLATLLGDITEKQSNALNDIA